MKTRFAIRAAILAALVYVCVAYAPLWLIVTLILGALSMPLATGWFFGVARVLELRREGVELDPLVRINASIVFHVGAIFDFLLNLVPASFLFLELPIHELTMSARLQRHVDHQSKSRLWAWRHDVAIDWSRKRVNVIDRRHIHNVPE